MAPRHALDATPRAACSRDHQKRAIQDDRRRRRRPRGFAGGRARRIELIVNASGFRVSSARDDLPAPYSGTLAPWRSQKADASPVSDVHAAEAEFTRLADVPDGVTEVQRRVAAPACSSRSRSEMGKTRCRVPSATPTSEL